MKLLPLLRLGNCTLVAALLLLSGPAISKDAGPELGILAPSKDDAAARHAVLMIEPQMARLKADATALRLTFSNLDEMTGRLIARSMMLDAMARANGYPPPSTSIAVSLKSADDAELARLGLDEGIACDNQPRSFSAGSYGETVTDGVGRQRLVCTTVSAVGESDASNTKWIRLVRASRLLPAAHSGDRVPVLMAVMEVAVRDGFVGTALIHDIGRDFETALGPTPPPDPGS